MATQSMIFIRSVAVLISALAVAVPQTTPENYWPTHGWQSSTPEAQGIDSGTLAQAFDFIRDKRIPIHSLLIVRNGRVVLDAAFYPYEAETPHDVASVTKSITSTLIGIAIGQHKLDGVKQKVLPLFPGRAIGNRDERKERLNIESLITMTSGLDCRSRPNELGLFQMLQSKNWLQFMLDLPMVAEPGAKFEYCSGGMHLLSGIISRVTGSSALEYARSQIFQPLGIEGAIWPADPLGNSDGWGDLHLRPRDMAKIGYLWLNHGRWGERQIVPEQWIDDAIKAHSEAAPGQEYGYGIWVYPNRNPVVYEGLGRGGQRISVAPANNLIAVLTGGGFEPGDIGDFIFKAVQSDRPLAANPEGQRRLEAAVRAAGRPPASKKISVSSISAGISGKTYLVDANPLKLRSFSIMFPGGAATVRLEFADGRVEQRPAGLDGVPRVSPKGRFGLPVALTGQWESERTFAFDYDEVGNINCYQFRLTFGDRDVSVAVKERTGLVAATFAGRRNGGTVN